MDYVTNGVHVPTVLVQDWVDLFDRNLGPDWRNHLSDRAYWERIHGISDQLFWGVRQSIKSKTLERLRQWLWRQHARNHVSEPHIERLLAQLNPEEPNVLTIGFARRFASYKRSTLLFNDLDWLRELVSDAERPVVFVFAGKAHPADEPGKALLKRIHEVGWMREFTGKVLLLEGYDLVIARALVAGVDVWLNNPVYPQEASGTSGMKAAINGTPNLSVTDGWWAEGFEGDNGWAIKPSPHLGDEHRRDAEDARTLYEILQDKVIPLYYDHGRHGYSPGWVAMCKRSMASILPRFNMNRVVQEYAAKLYAPAASKGRAMDAQGRAGARVLAEWRRRVEAAWPRVGLRRLHDEVAPVRFGERVPLEVAVQLDGLEPADVVVELLLTDESAGPVADDQDASRPLARPGLGESGPPWSARVPFAPGERIVTTGEHRYRLDFEPEACGRQVGRVRVYPWHEMLSHPLETGLMAWLE